MQLKNYLKRLNLKQITDNSYCLFVILVLIIFLLPGCSSLKNPLVRTELIKQEIQIQTRPKPVQLNSIHFYVVTEDNFDDFKSRFLEENVEFVFYAISVKDYEKLSLNMSDIVRYLRQQKELIIYYETEIQRPLEDPEK